MDSYKGRIRKNKSAGLIQGKTACFPLWREAKQEVGANHPFSRNAALRRLRFTEVANHGARAVIDSELSFYPDQAQILFLKSESPGSIQKKNLVGLLGESPVSPLTRKGQEGAALASHSPF